MGKILVPFYLIEKQPSPIPNMMKLYNTIKDVTPITMYPFCSLVCSVNVRICVFLLPVILHARITLWCSSAGVLLHMAFSEDFTSDQLVAWLEQRISNIDFKLLKGVYEQR